jgi:hypothetical protein
MGYTKREFVSAALEELGMADYIFDASADELQGICRRLDSMVANWSGIGVKIGYPIPVNPSDSDIDQQTGVPTWANDGIICSLAVRIAPSFGKIPQPETKSTAKQGYDVILQRCILPVEVQLPDTMPVGAGNKQWVWGGVFQPTPTDDAVDPPSTAPDFLI